MSKLHLNKTNLVCLAVGVMTFLPGYSFAQVPMYQIFGVDPYRTPNAVPLQHFSPLQRSYSTPGAAQSINPHCIPCVVAQPIIQPYSIVGQAPPIIHSQQPVGLAYIPEQGATAIIGTPTFAASEVPAEIVAGSIVSADAKSDPTDDSNPTIQPQIESTPTRENPLTNIAPELVAPDSLASPSDLATQSDSEPTLAGNASAEIVKELDEARKQITTLKDELTETRRKGRASAERAYAAEKSASAAKMRADSLVEMKAAQGAETAKEAEAQLRTNQVQLAEMENRLVVEAKEFQNENKRSVEKEQVLRQKLDRLVLEQKKIQKRFEMQKIELQKSQNDLTELEKTKTKIQPDKKANVEKLKSNAQERLERLLADAKSKKNSKSKAGNNSKDSQKARATANDQVKKLRESMERQIKRSNDQIRNRSESKIDQVLKSGKSKDSKAVQKIADEMKAQMKANEEKIRKRIDERIKRIQKESAARGKS